MHTAPSNPPKTFFSNRIETQTLLSILWIVVMLNMLKADILSLFIPGTAQILAKTAGDTPIPYLMLGGAVMMELAIIMVFLSYTLKHPLNRPLNIIASTITIVFIWAGMVSYPHYIFIAIVETLCLLSIIYIAWSWRPTTSHSKKRNIDDAKAIVGSGGMRGFGESRHPGESQRINDLLFSLLDKLAPMCKNIVNTLTYP